jgi:rhodanese-related sulfurtransferase/predicted RNA methylase
VDLTSQSVADFIGRLGPASVLDAGCGSGALAVELQDRGLDVVGVDLDPTVLADAIRRAPQVRWERADLAVMQLDRRFDVVAFAGAALEHCEPPLRRAVVHTSAQHLLPSGAVVSALSLRPDPSCFTFAEFDALCADCDLHLEQRWGGWDCRAHDGGDFVVSVHRRTARYNVHDMLFDARASIRRMTPVELLDHLRSVQPPLVVDTRTAGDRERFGVIGSAIHVPRTVVEWHLDPANGYRHPAVRSFDQPIVVVCNDGYSSSLSAANLVRIGFTSVADMIGGMTAWSAAGLPTVAPSDTHVDDCR